MDRIMRDRLKRLDYELETVMASIEYKLWLLHTSNGSKGQVKGNYNL